MSDTTLLLGIRLITGRFSPVARLYYYRGNFYWPMDVHGSETGRIKRAIRDFKKSNYDREPQGCSCHISPPCNYCVNNIYDEP